MLLHPQECQLLLATIWNQRESWRRVFTTASQTVNLAHIIVLDVWSLKLWQNEFLLFQPPQPGSSLSQQWGETHRGRSCFVLLQVMVNVTKTWYPHKKEKIETQMGRMYMKTQGETGMVVHEEARGCWELPGTEKAGGVILRAAKGSTALLTLILDSWPSKLLWAT